MVKVHEIYIGNTLNCDKQFKELLKPELSTWIEETSAYCDVIVAFCPIVSRVGTDVQAALGKIPDTTPAVLVVFHHTFDEDYVVPDTKRFVERQNMITVNCLFNESQGLLTGPVLERAVKDTLDFVKQYDEMKIQKRTLRHLLLYSYNYLKRQKRIIVIGYSAILGVGVYYLIYRRNSVSSKAMGKVSH